MPPCDSVEVTPLGVTRRTFDAACSITASAPAALLHEMWRGWLNRAALPTPSIERVPFWGKNAQSPAMVVTTPPLSTRMQPIRRSLKYTGSAPPPTSATPKTSASSAVVSAGPSAPV